MALNFPPSPEVNDIHSDGVRSWKWNGTAWDSYSAAQTVTTVNGLTGPITLKGAKGITQSVGSEGISFSINFLKGGQTFPSSAIVSPNDVLLLQHFAGVTMYTATVNDVITSNIQIPDIEYTDTNSIVGKKLLLGDKFQIDSNTAISQILNGAVTSFNGLTGAVTGVTTGVSNSFTPIQTFLGGINVSGATFSNNVQIIGDLIVTGRIITETGMFGATYNAAIEVVDNLSMDGGEF
jgi:hypothetical protein